MKKLLLILLCLPIIGFGQFLYKLDSLTLNYPISFNYPETTLYEFEYDSQGNTTKVIIPNPGDSTKHIMNSVGTILYSYDAYYTFLQYNTNNQLTSSYTALLKTSNQNIETMINTTYSFDSNNNVIGWEEERTTLGNSIFDYADGMIIGSGVGGKSKRTYTYDINFQNTLEKEWDWDGSQYVETYKADKIWQSGINTSIIRSHYYNNSWEITKISTFTFLLGDISENKNIFYSGGVPQDTSTNYYYYNNELMTNTASFFGTVLANEDSHSQSLHQTESIEFELLSGFGNYEYYYSAFTSTEINEYNKSKQLLKVTDLLGRETKGTNNEVLFYIYDDGTVEKRIIIE